MASRSSRSKRKQDDHVEAVVQTNQSAVSSDLTEAAATVSQTQLPEPAGTDSPAVTFSVPNDASSTDPDSTKRMRLSKMSSIDVLALQPVSIFGFTFVFPNTKC